MEFIDREQELASLRQLFESDKFEFLSLIGRRRTGKTELIRKFLEEVDGIYLFIPMSDDKQLRLQIADRLNQAWGLSFVGEPSWRQIIDKLFDYSAGNKVFVVFDEFQRILNINKTVPSLIQNAIDSNKDSSKMLLCVAGSSIGMMKEMFDSDASLYGRRTRNMNLRPFDYEKVRKWLKGEERSMIERYGVFGGTPKYLEFIRQQPLLANIEQEILNPDSLLYDEPRVLLSTELKTPDKYFNILKLISEGKETPKKITDPMDLERTSLSYYLNKLVQDLDLIKRVAPVTDKISQSKNRHYRLKDNFFRFWFRFVYPHQDQLEMGNQQGIKDKIEKEFNGYLGQVFEEIVRGLVRRNNGGHLVDWELNRYEKIGSWWDRQGNEIDVCGISKQKTLLGEVKWGSLDVKQTQKLVQKLKSSRLENKSQFLLASRQFSREAKDFLKEQGIIHFSINQFSQIFS